MTPNPTTAPLAVPPRNLPQRLQIMLWALIAIGVVSFLLGALAGDAARAWQTYLVNFLFWSSLAQGGIIFSAAYRQTNGGWGEPLRRLGESMIAFLPVSFGLFLGLLGGYRHLYSWAREPVHGKEVWLSPTFLFVRDGVALLVLLGLSGLYVYHVLRPELGRYRQAQGHTGTLSALIDRLTRDWRGAADEEARSRTVLGWLTPLLLVAFVVLYSFLSFDLVMSIDPHWYSTLFGWFYCVSTFYLTLAGIGVASVIARRLFDLREQIPAAMFHDLGKLIFGFCLLTGGFFWTRYLVIWYGNLTEEIQYVILRMSQLPWAVVSWGVVGLGYMLPLAVLLSRSLKRRPLAMLLMGTLILVMMWLERFVAIVPSVWSGRGVPLGALEVGITAGFAGAFALSWLSLARHLPLVPLTPQDPATP